MNGDLYEQPEYQLLLKRYTALRQEYAQLSDDYDTLLYCRTHEKPRNSGAGVPTGQPTRNTPLTPSLTPGSRIVAPNLRFQSSDRINVPSLSENTHPAGIHPMAGPYLPMMPQDRGNSTIPRYAQADSRSCDDSEGEDSTSALSPDHHHGDGSPGASLLAGGPDFKCPHCSAVLSTAYVLRRHIRAKHTEGSARIHCEECSATFSYASDLKRHVLSKHEGQKYVCSECGKEYARDTSLKDHLRKMH